MLGFGNHRKRTIKPWKLWDEIISAVLTKNVSTDAIIRQAPYYVDFKGIYSGINNVTYLYSIDGYPSELELSYRSSLRRECKHGVRISFISTFERYVIPWESPQMKSKLRTWKILENDGADVDEYNLHQNMAQLDSQAWRKESLVYLNDAEIRRKRKMFKFRSIMLISGKRGDAFDETVEAVVRLCRAENIKINRIMVNIEDYLNVFSPYSNSYDDKILKQVGSNVITDEILARFNTYSQGTVGKEGICWGNDIYSSFACLKPVKAKAEDAESWLITAETGGGKSYFAKGLLLQLLANDIFNGTIMDIEGFEYLPLAYFMADDNPEDVVIINMAEGTGAYFDPVEIILTGDEKVDAGMFSLSKSFTLSIFKVLLGVSDDTSNSWVDIVINDAISETYTNRGVVPTDESTWGNSEGLTLFDVYKTLKSMSTTRDKKDGGLSQGGLSDYEKRYEANQAILGLKNDVSRMISTNEEYQDAVESCLAKVSRYFEETGTMSSVFRRRINVEDIIEAKLVLCSFGMAGKTEKTVDPIQMALSQLCAASISYLRSVFSKQQGKFNFKVWEEFQRWGSFPDSDKTITTALTGGRKLGDINIIITNKVSELLENDRFSVFGNLTSVAIGCIWDSKVREELCDRLSLPQMLPELDRLVTENKNLSAYNDGDNILSNPYSKAFLIGLDKTVFAISRMAIPPDLAESSLFRTGIDMHINDDGDLEFEDEDEYDTYDEDYEDAQGDYDDTQTDGIDGLEELLDLPSDVSTDDIIDFNEDGTNS